MTTINLPFQKVPGAISYNEVERLSEFDNLKAMPSTSQMTKRMSPEQFEEVSALLEAGEDVEIKG
jgi:hypothetical protein